MQQEGANDDRRKAAQLGHHLRRSLRLLQVRRIVREQASHAHQLILGKVRSGDALSQRTAHRLKQQHMHRSAPEHGVRLGAANRG